MLNKMFSLIGKSISYCGGLVPAATQFVYTQSFPAAGTFNSWLYDVEYPVANGGGEVYTTSYYPNQFCDVQVKNNGTGGTYTDWTTATDIQYKVYGSEINSESGSYNISVCSGTYSIGSSTTVYYHDGNGGYYSGGGASYNSYGTYITNCDGYNYYSDGSGSYYTQSDGSGGGGSSYPSYGTFAYYDDASGYSAYHDGNGGLYYA